MQRFPGLHSRTARTCHVPQCSCPVGPVVDYQLREFRNGTLHVYPYCRCCGKTAQSPVRRERIPLKKWKELLIEFGQEVKPL